MKQGYTKAWRKEIDCDLWRMPPIYQRVFYYLRQKARWQAELVPTREGMGIWLLPGQMITSLDGIAKGVAWYEYGVEKVPNRRTIGHILEYLSKLECIETVSHTKGTTLFITNWITYQQNDDEVGTPSIHRVHTIKEVKEVKEVKEESKALAGDDETSPPPPPVKVKKPKPPKEKKPISADHPLFIAWWCHVFEQTQEDTYIVEGAKDGQAAKSILAGCKEGIREAMGRACYFLAEDDPFWRGKHTIALFRSQINKCRPSVAQVDKYRRMGLFPPTGDDVAVWVNTIVVGGIHQAEGAVC